MKELLQKLLKKKGIDDLDQLSVDERTVFDNYNKVLSKEVLTIEDFRRFLETQVTIIEQKWKNYDMKNSDKAELLPYFTCYKTLLQTIDAPLVEKRALEDYLVQQIDTL